MSLSNSFWESTPTSIQRRKNRSIIIDTMQEFLAIRWAISLNKSNKVAKIRNRYNQVPHLNQDTNGKVTNSQKTPPTRAKRSAPSQQATTKHTQTDAHKTQQTQDRTKTQKTHKRSTAPERSVKHFTGGLKPVQRRQPHP